MKVVSESFEEQVKCGGCLWHVVTLYSFPGHDIRQEGICAQCFMEMIAGNGWEISSGEVKEW